MTNDITTPEDDDLPGLQPSHIPEVFALVVAWCRDEPWRVGEVLTAPRVNPEIAGRAQGPAAIFGRGPGVPGEPPKTQLGQLRPGQWLPSPPLVASSVSRQQLSIHSIGNTSLRVKNMGRCALFKNGEPVFETELQAGDLLQIGKQLLFVCAPISDVRRGTTLGYPDFAFGQADPYGIVGESRAAWQLRNQIAFVAARRGHVLICGRSGAGKELVARAIHGLSSRASKPLVARNAATLPETLIDAELFGNAKNYPNPGMLDRPGLIGEAHGSTLFLDEFAELPQTAQAHLLRVLDGGEYQRLGESKQKTSDFRLLAATNRELSVLKHDVLARFTFKLNVPDLSLRKEDIPLIARHILRKEAEAGDPLSRQKFPEGDLQREPMLSLNFVRALLEACPSDVRTLQQAIWEALANEELGLSSVDADEPQARSQSSDEPRQDSEYPEADDESQLARGTELTAECIERVLYENNGVIEQTWRALGLPNRFVLLRLLRKHKLEVRRRPWQKKPAENK